MKIILLTQCCKKSKDKWTIPTEINIVLYTIKSLHAQW